MIAKCEIRIVRGICVGLCLTVLLTAGAAVLAAEEASPLSPEDVAALRSVGEVAMSPDGNLAAYTLRVPRRVGEDEDGPSWSELHVVGREGSSRGYVTGEVRIERIAWTADGAAITFLGRRGDETERRLFSIAIDGGEARELMDHGSGILEYSWSPGSDRLAVLAKPEEDEGQKELEEKGFKQKVFEEQWKSVQLWLSTVDGTEIGEPEQVPLKGSASDISFSPDGTRLLVALAPTSLVDDGYMKRRLHVLDVESREIVASIETGGKLGRIAWSPDGAHLALIAGADAHDPVAARLMVVKVSGGVPEQPFQGQSTDVVDVGWLDAETIVCIRASGVDRRIEKLSLGGQPEVIVDGGGPIWSRFSLAPGSGILAAIGDTPSHPAEVFFAAVKGPAPARATDSNAWLADRHLAPQEVVTFSARDGLELQGLLLHPLNRSSDERNPLIMIVHGGPEAHFANGWLTTYSRPGQVLAGRGYAVFYPNYRGSTGRGLAFAKTSQGDPAGKEFDDLIDGVDHLIGSGLVDRDRVGITGGSYGGYATAWGATYYTERFAAGVMAVGISEQLVKLGTSDIPNELYLVHARMWPWENWQKNLERSPVYYVEKARTPLLIMGGDADPRVHPSQSLALYRYLKILGNAPVRYVIYPGERHGNAKAAARFDFSLRLLRWFDHYLMGPGGDPPAHELDYGVGTDTSEENSDG